MALITVIIIMIIICVRLVTYSSQTALSSFSFQRDEWNYYPQFKMTVAKAGKQPEHDHIDNT